MAALNPAAGSFTSTHGESPDDEGVWGRVLAKLGMNRTKHPAAATKRNGVKTGSRAGSKSAKGAKKTKGAKRARTGSTAVKPSLRPGPRGFKGRGMGEAQVLHPVKEMRGTNYQVCGLYPFPMGGGAPLEGVPLGRNLLSNEPVCCDPISWFQNVRLISNPSAFIMANPGLGKSSLLRRMAIGLCAFGVNR